MSFASTYKMRQKIAKDASFALNCVVNPNQVRIYPNNKDRYIIKGLTREQSSKLVSFYKNGKKLVQNGFISVPIKSEVVPNGYEFKVQTDDNIPTNTLREIAKVLKRY